MRTTVASASPFSPGFRRCEAVTVRRSGSGAAHGLAAGAVADPAGAGVAAGGGALCGHPDMAGTPPNPTNAAVVANPLSRVAFARMFRARSLPANGRTAQAKGHLATARPPRVRARDHLDRSLAIGRRPLRPLRHTCRSAHSMMGAPFDDTPVSPCAAPPPLLLPPPPCSPGGRGFLWCWPPPLTRSLSARVDSALG